MLFGNTILSSSILGLLTTARAASDVPSATTNYYSGNIYGYEKEETQSASQSASATSLASCNPLETTSCSPDPALASTIEDNFKSSSSHYTPYRFPSRITYGDDGVNFTLAERLDNPSLVSNDYIMFGRLEVQMKSAKGKGVISSFYLQSDDLDEIDLEWFGGDGSQVQSNFFSKGNTTTYDRGEYHSISDPRADFHNYTIDWTSSELKWYFDGELLRTLKNDSSSGYPQSPMRIYFGVWAGGDYDNGEGVIEWAGGLTDYSEAPFVMQVQNLVVSDYSTGSEYKYSGDSGDWTSIEAVDGKVMGRESKAINEFNEMVSGDSASSINSSSDSSETQKSTTSVISTDSVQHSSASRTSSIAAEDATSSADSSTITESVSSSTEITDNSTTLSTIYSEHSSENESGSTTVASSKASADQGEIVRPLYSCVAAITALIFAMI